MTSPRVSAFRWIPRVAQGLVRDLRVRWALEEVDLYEERLIGPEDQRSETYLSLQPFGQVPSYEEDGLALFESGAIVLHIAERSDKLMPSGPEARARTKTWMLAALNTVEPPIMFLNALDMLQGRGAPAFQKALADQMARFAENAPATNSASDRSC
jgi:glutathione S-transferase